MTPRVSQNAGLVGSGIFGGIGNSLSPKTRVSEPKICANWTPATRSNLNAQPKLIPALQSVCAAVI